MYMATDSRPSFEEPSAASEEEDDDEEEDEEAEEDEEEGVAWDRERSFASTKADSASNVASQRDQEAAPVPVPAASAPAPAPVGVGVRLPPKKPGLPEEEGRS
jgi:hypothetical protein